MDEDYAKRTERIKALLSSYYGTEQGPQEGEESASHPAPLPDVSRFTALPAIDSPGFNAERHIQQMLKTYDLDKLLTEHRSMAREIKNLDSDMQQLVYENYNKFIAATDTIRTMKSSVDSMGSDMEKLKSIMDTVADKSTSVTAKLARRRDHLEELAKAQGLLHKLQAVFDLPRRMQAAVDADAVETAVAYYAGAAPLLKKYRNKGAFRSVASEADAIARDLSSVLKKRLTERKGDDAEQLVLLLRRLGEADDALQDKYLQGRATRLRKMLSEAGLVVDAMAAAGLASALPASAGVHTPSPLPHPNELENPVSWGFATDPAHVGRMTPPTLKVFLRSLDERVINGVRETVLNVTTIFMQADEADPSKRRPLVLLATEVFDSYFKVVRRAIADFIGTSVLRAVRMKQSTEEVQWKTEDVVLDLGSDWGAETLVQALTTISTDVSRVSAVLPELSLSHRTLDLGVATMQQHIRSSFAALHTRLARLLEMSRSTLVEQGHSGPTTSDALHNPLLRHAHTHARELVVRGLSSVMGAMKPYEGTGRGALAFLGETLHDTMQMHLQHWFLHTLLTVADLTNANYKELDQTREAERVAAGQVSPQDAALPTHPALSVALGVRTYIQVADGSTNTTQVASNDVPKTGLVLLLSKLMTHLEQSAVPMVMEALASSAAAHGPGSGRARDLPPPFVPGEVARRLNRCSAALLAAYVELHGRSLSLMVRRSVVATNWLHAKEPRGPRPVCDLLVERLGRAEAEVVQLVEETGRRPEAGPGMGSRYKAGNRDLDASTALETGNVERSMARLFKEKIRVNGDIQFTQATILAAIISVGLKSLVECIRLQTLGRAGLQQLQLDTHYLRPLLRRYTGGGRAASIVDSLLDEVVSAGVERSVDPSLLEVTVLDRILSSSEG